MGDGLTFASFYAGAGGLDLGFVEQGFVPAWVNEVESDSIETYRQIVGYPSSLRLTAGPIEEAILPQAGSVDLVVGGPPCQGFSRAGHMDPTDPRSKHVVRFIEAVAAIEPRAFVMENVATLAVSSRWKSLMEFLRVSAESAGLTTRTVVLDAADAGVAQRRRRMFMIGLRDTDWLGAKGPLEARARFLTVSEALQRLPAVGQVGNDSEIPARIVFAKNPVMRRSPFAGMLFNGSGRPLRLSGLSTTLPATMGGNRTPIVDQLSLETGDEQWVVGYHEYLMNGGDPIEADAPPRLRRITVQEAAALQGFSPGATFVGSRTSQLRQIGNSVPPPLARAVASFVRTALRRRRTANR